MLGGGVAFLGASDQLSVANQGPGFSKSVHEIDLKTSLQMVVQRGLPTPKERALSPKANLWVQDWRLSDTPANGLGPGARLGLGTWDLGLKPGPSPGPRRSSFGAAAVLWPGGDLEPSENPRLPSVKFRPRFN